MESQDQTAPARPSNGRSQFSRRVPLLGLVVGLAALLVVSVGGAFAASVGLGTADNFGVLAGSGVTNTGPTVVNGDLGTCPTPAITGVPPGVVNGTIHAGDAVACQAQSDLTIAYNSAAGRAPTTTLAGTADLGGSTLTVGVYKADSFAITGSLTLDAQGDPSAVFIFQAASTLITAPNSRVVLINGAQACNVFWQVGSSATLGVGSGFIGTILALTSITANTNATVAGRLLARNGAVTLDSNTVTRPVCSITTTTSSSTTTTLATTTTVPTATTTTVPATTTTTEPAATTTTLPAATTTTEPAATTTTVPVAITTTLPAATTIPTATTLAPTTTLAAATILPATTTTSLTTTTTQQGNASALTTTTTLGATTALPSTTGVTVTSTTVAAPPVVPTATDRASTTTVTSAPDSGSASFVAQSASTALALTGGSLSRDATAGALAVMLGCALVLLSTRRGRGCLPRVGRGLVRG